MLRDKNLHFYMNLNDSVLFNHGLTYNRSFWVREPERTLFCNGRSSDLARVAQWQQEVHEALMIMNNSYCTIESTKMP
jgi:hypothetical protein